MKTVKKLLALNLALLLLITAIPIEVSAAMGDLGSGPINYTAINGSSDFTFTPGVSGLYQVTVLSDHDKPGRISIGARYWYYPTSNGVTSAVSHYAYLDAGTQYTIRHTPNAGVLVNYTISISAAVSQPLTLGTAKTYTSTTPSDLFTFTPSVTGWYNNSVTHASARISNERMSTYWDGYDDAFLIAGATYHIGTYGYTAVQASILLTQAPASSFVSLPEGVITQGEPRTYRLTPSTSGEYTVVVKSAASGADLKLYTATEAVSWQEYNADRQVVLSTFTAKTNLTAGTDYYVGFYPGYTTSYTILASNTSVPVALTGKPVITGVGANGACTVLTASLSGISPDEITWQWMLDGADIPGATGRTYLPVMDDAGKAITVKAVAVPGGNYTGESPASDAFAMPPFDISGAVTVSETDGGGVSGTIEEDDTLTADVTGILPAAAQTGLAYQWFLNDAEIVNENGASYIISGNISDDRIWVEVTAGGQFQGTISSEPVVVGKEMISLTQSLVIAGGTAVGDDITLTKSNEYADDDVTYIWMRGNAVIGEATGDSPVYSVTSQDSGYSIYVKMVGKAGSTYTGAAVSNALAIPVTVPEAPAVTATAGDGRISVSWTAPFDGGCPIVGYTVQVDGQAPVSKDANETGHTFTGLTNGQSYTVRVVATNRTGNSPAGTATATPVGSSSPDSGSSVSSGGGSGGSSAVTIKAETDDETSRTTMQVEITQKNSAVTLLLPNSTVQSLLKNMPERKNAEASVTFELSKVKAATSATMPTSAVKTFGDEGIEMILKLPAATLSLAPQALKALAADGQSGESLIIEAQEITPEGLSDTQRALAQGNKVIDINIYLGKRKVDIPVTVSLAYTLGDGEIAQGVTVWHMDDDSLTVMGGNYDTDTGLHTFEVPHQSYYVIGYVPPWPFTDVGQDDWFYDAVKYVYENGVMTGTESTLFDPHMPMNRAMMVTALYRLEGEPAVDGLANTFTDVSVGKWYTNAIIWAAENGIVLGYNETAFGPTNSITREQMVSILYRYADFKGLDVSSAGALDAFDDAGSISGYARPAMAWAVAEGYVNGRTADTLVPLDTTTRAEIATLFQRFMT